MRRILLFFILIGTIVGIYIGISKHNQVDIVNNSEENQTIVENYIDEITMPFIITEKSNPLKNVQIHDSYILQLIYESLVMFDNSNQVTGMLASEWMKKDEYTWLIRIRDNVMWHNGEKLTSSDVIYTMNFIKDEKNESIYASNLKNVLNVEMIDERSIEVKLAQPDSDFISKLTFPIVSKRYFENTEANNNEISKNLMGTGPYKCVAEYDSSIVLTSNEKWWKDEEIKLKTINLKKYTSYNEAVKAFKSTEVDMILTNMYNWKEIFGFIGINSYKFESTKYDVLIPNAKKYIFEDNSVRKMLLYGINRDNIVNDVYEGNAIISDIPLMSNSKFSEMNAEYDVETAKQILINGSWEYEGGRWKRDNKELKFTLIVSNEEKDKLETAEKIKLDMEEIGVDVIIKPMKKEEFLKRIQEDDFEIALATLDIKNENTIKEIVEENNEKNYANYVNEKITKEIEDLKNVEGEAYNEKFKSLCSMYKNDIPYVGLYFKANNILSNKAVKGEYKSTAYEPFRNIINFYK